jgi:hypothetical protein
MFVVFSANVNEEQVKFDLKGLHLPIKQVQVCRGAYEGVEEQAFVVHANYDALPAIHELVLGAYEQAALLVIDFNSQCQMYTVGKGAVAVPCGTWRKVSQAYALNRDAYTRIAQDYFVVE